MVPGLTPRNRGWSRTIALAALALLIAFQTPVELRAKTPSQQESTQLSPQELFKRVSRSVFVVEALDSQGSVIAFGSGVVVQRPGQETPPETLPADFSDWDNNYLITNSHVLDGAASVRVRRGDKSWAATIVQCDVEADLCQLDVPGLNAPPSPLRLSATLQVGEHVYAVGAPEGLELTFSEGIISGLRESGGPGRIIQTTAPVSHGSSGGGLFDAAGHLLGITTFVLKEGQNLNFALPVEAIVAIEKSPNSPSPAGGEGAKKPAVVADRCDPSGIRQLLADLGLGEPSVAPSESEKWVCRGDEAKRAANLKGAIEAYRRAIELDPRGGIAHERLGRALEEQGDMDGAIAEYRERVRLWPDSVDTHLDLGNMLVAKGNLDDALTETHEAVRLAPQDPYAHAGLCNALAKKGDLNAALVECRKALSLKPDAALLPWLDRRYGLLLQADGDLDGAITEFREAARLEPAEPAAHYRLGSALYKKGQLAPAESELREALRINPSYAEARLALGEVLEGKCVHDRMPLFAAVPTDDIAAAAPVLEEALTYPFQSCGQAVIEIRKAVNLKANWAEAHYQLAEDLWMNGDAYRDEAIREYATACSLDPSNPKFCNDYQDHDKRWDSKHHRRK
jgi:S1-C subfamily serine protease/Flp pilus assembly protein TadD